MGRRKIEIERISNKHDRFICFSKRRKGLFKKANDLALRGFQIIVLVFSTTGNAFVYGSPNVEAVFERFLQNAAANDAGSSNNTNTAENLIKSLEECKEKNEEEQVSTSEDETEERTQEDDLWAATETEERTNTNGIEERTSKNGIEERTEENDTMLAIEFSSNSSLTENEQFWWNRSVDNLSREGLLQFKSALEELFKSVRRKADSLLVEQDFLAGFD